HQVLDGSSCVRSSGRIKQNSNLLRRCRTCRDNSPQNNSYYSQDSNKRYKKSFQHNAYLLIQVGDSPANEERNTTMLNEVIKKIEDAQFRYHHLTARHTTSIAATIQATITSTPV